MTQKIGDVVIITPEPPGTCEYCGAFDELRPYGRKGARICFNCAMLPENKPETERRVRKLFHG